MTRLSGDAPAPFWIGPPTSSAGPFVFTSGCLAPDARGIAPDRLLALPDRDQTASIIDGMRRSMGDACGAEARFVKVRSVHRSMEAMPGHAEARRLHFTEPFPPSTGVEGTVPHPHANVMMDGIGVRVDEPVEWIRSNAVPVPKGPYVQGARVGPFVFLAGVLASDFRSRVAPAARVPHHFGHFESALRVQTTYVLDVVERLLADAGLDVDHVLRANVIVTDITALWALEEVWKQRFPRSPRPSRTIVEAGLVHPGCVVEIDVVASTSELPTEIVSDIPSSPHAETDAVRVGDWVFIGGQMPLETVGDGDTTISRPTEVESRYVHEVAVQTASVVDRIRRLLDAAGADVASLRQMTLYVEGDEADCARATEQLFASIGHEAVPAVSVLGVRALPVPGVRVSIDALAATGPP